MRKKMNEADPRLAKSCSNNHSSRKQVTISRWLPNVSDARQPRVMGAQLNITYRIHVLHIECAAYLQNTSVLTVLAARPEVWLFEQAAAEERMKVKLLVQVCRARLLRSDDEEIWKTAQTVRPTC